ncbi:MAG: hypothetical protein HQL93_11835, partial [Magnetococcales bacterium]|nr:hypothetical protein [Magnetococcales bacterium]
LTLLTTNGAEQQTKVEQFFIIKLEKDLLTELLAFGKKHKIDIRKNYLFTPCRDKGLVILRAEYEHTDAGLPSTNGALKEEHRIHENWVRLKEEAIMPIVPGETVRIGFSFTNLGENQKADKKLSTECG